MTTFYISTQTPTNFDQEGYEALEWVEIGEPLRGSMTPAKFHEMYKQEPTPSKDTK